MSKHFTQVMQDLLDKKDTTHRVTKPLTMVDGFSVSVQASKGHYCCPREDLNYSEYSEFELGFPSEKEDLIMPYVEDESCPEDTVYGYVPKDVVEAVITKHGGLVDE